MHVQWIIISRRSGETEDDEFNIEGILRKVVFPGPPYIISPLTVTARFTPEIEDIGASRNCALVIAHEDGLQLLRRTFTSPPMSVDEWLNVVPFVKGEMDQVTFPKPGLYAFSIFVEDTLKVQEWLLIVDKGKE